MFVTACYIKLIGSVLSIARCIIVCMFVIACTIKLIGLVHNTVALHVCLLLFVM
jgi:hypothetical protein